MNECVYIRRERRRLRRAKIPQNQNNTYEKYKRCFSGLHTCVRTYALLAVLYVYEVSVHQESLLLLGRTLSSLLNMEARERSVSFSRRRISIPLLLVFLPWLLLYSFTDPSCRPLSQQDERLIRGGGDLRFTAMVVADLHLSGPATAWLDRLLREAFMKTSFQRAYKAIQPQALLVLGDVSDWGRKSTDAQWRSVLGRFDDVARPYLDLPYHVSAGNHDIGDFYQMTPGLIDRFASSFPGLDETGSSTFVIRNVSFVALNAMALACDDCPSHAVMRRVVEDAKRKLRLSSSSSPEPERPPILLLHLPLYRADESVCNAIDIPRCAPWHEVEGECVPLFGRKRSRAPPPTAYRSRMDMLSLSTSRSLIATLQPSLVLSAHAHRLCDRRLDGQTREVTASTFTARNRDDPSFLLLYVYADGSHTIHHCSLPPESRLLLLAAAPFLIAPLSYFLLLFCAMAKKSQVM